MKLLYLSAENLRNTAFIKDLVYHFKGVGKAIIVHDHFGSLADTRFVTKRLSALLSEEMITNNAFSGDQRRILERSMEDIYAVQLAFLQERFETVDVLILNAIGLNNGVVEALPPQALVGAIRQMEDVEAVYVFAKNARSPLVTQARWVQSEADVAALREVYPEEMQAMDMAVALAPCVLAAPGNFKTLP